MSDTEKQSRSTAKKDVPPKPKGTYGDGSTTTRVDSRSDGVMSVPSSGGTHRAGKDPSNCDDALGNPGRHHGEASQAVAVSGRGPAAAAKQHTTGRRTGINSKNENDFSKDQTTEDMNPVKRSTHKEKK